MKEGLHPAGDQYPEGWVLVHQHKGASTIVVEITDVDPQVLIMNGERIGIIEERDELFNLRMSRKTSDSGIHPPDGAMNFLVS